MKYPLVSVVVPVYNKEHYVARAIKSILSQTYRNYEIIVVDDGSTDGSRRALAPYWKRIKYLWQENMGPGAARNRGVQASSGEYLAFLDADDYWLEGFLKTTVSFLETHPEIDVVSTAYWLKRPKEMIRWPPVRREPKEGPVEDFFRAYARAPRFCCTDSVLLRRSAFFKAGKFRTDLASGEDVELWCCLGAIGRWGYIAQPLAVYDETVFNSIVRTSHEMRKRTVFNMPDWERRIIGLLDKTSRSSYQDVRWHLLMGQLRFLIAFGEYQQAKSLAALYSSKFSKLRGFILWSLARTPVSVLQGTRWSYYQAKKLLGMLKNTGCVGSYIENQG